VVVTEPVTVGGIHDFHHGFGNGLLHGLEYLMGGSGGYAYPYGYPYVYPYTYPVAPPAPGPYQVPVVPPVRSTASCPGGCNVAGSVVVVPIQQTESRGLFHRLRDRLRERRSGR
jgi:hypothetical protein